MARDNFRSMKYGMFVHYVAGVSCRADGIVPATADETADNFNAEGFADDLRGFGVEYVIFTAWHFNMHCLYPSKAMDRWLPGHQVRRDLIGDMIRAVKSRGIGVVLYTHPRDGHDFSEADAIETGWGAGGNAFRTNPNPGTFDFGRWNDFLNDVYTELIDLYGDEILGVYLDEGHPAADSERIVDYRRLRRTIKKTHPELMMIQNYFGNLYSCDIGDKEYRYWGEFASTDGGSWPSYHMPVASVIGSNWMAKIPRGEAATRFAVEDLYRYTVLQAGCCTDGGGVQWAAGPYVGGGWEDGVAETMTALGELIEPVAEAILDTYPSDRFRTLPGTTTAELDWGVATRSADGRREYLHVLNPPEGNTLSLPLPFTGIRFSKATLLPENREIGYEETESHIVVRLAPGDSWKHPDTVIALDLKR